MRQGADETAANTEALRSQVRQAMLDTDIGILQSAMNSPEVILQMNDLPEASQGNAFVWFQTLIRSREHYWGQHKSGLIDDQAYQSYMNIFVGNLQSSPMYRAMWDGMSQGGLERGFVEEINTLLEATGNDQNTAAD